MTSARPPPARAPAPAAAGNLDLPAAFLAGRRTATRRAGRKGLADLAAFPAAANEGRRRRCP